MKKSNSISCSKNIFLNQDRMDELYTILLRHCKKITIEAKTIDNASIEFESYDELMGYSNFNKGRIKRLEITGYNSVDRWDRKIYRIFSSEHSTSSSVDCTYYFTQTDEEAIFKQEIVNFWDKATKSYGQAVVFNWIVRIALLSIPAYVFFCHPTTDWVATIVCIYVLAFIATELFNKFIWAKLFPAVSFSWGESIEYYRRIDRWKNGVFWSIIIAIPVAIIANYLFALLKGG